MHSIKLSVVYRCLQGFFWAGVVLLATACSTAVVDKTANMSPTQIYAEAQDQIQSNQYDKAVPLLDKLEARAAGTPLAQQAQIDKAYAQYRAKDSVLAIATLERFIRLHPTSPAMDYALYLKGMANFNEDLGIFGSYTGQDLAERDQKAAKESFESFRELTTRFPDSKYASDAKLRMTFTVASLARYEVYVAKYYFRRGAYLAALNRAQTAINDYRDVPAMEDALFTAYKCYEALGMTQLKDDTRRVLQSTYPNSELLKAGGKGDSGAWLKSTN